MHSFAIPDLFLDRFGCIDMPDVIKRVKFQLSSRDGQQRHQAASTRYRQVYMARLALEFLDEAIDSLACPFSPSAISKVVEGGVIEFQPFCTERSGTPAPPHISHP